MKKIMKKIMKKAILLTMITVLFFESGITSTAATTNTNISIGNYIKLIVDASNLTVNTAENNSYIKAALREGLIKEGEFSSYSVNITKEETAVIANRADELLHGTSYDETLYQQIKSKKRISDFGKMNADNQDAMIKVFAKGIMIGSSNGKYTHSRKFNGKDYLTTSEAKAIVAKVKNSSKRRKLSPDGQLIRTTKLPKNYKSYEYILESFPNAFYEKKFIYQTRKYYYKPVEFKDYASPARLKKTTLNGNKMQEVLDNHLDTWAKKIETNLKIRLNVDYRTIDNEWISTLRKTYYVYGDASADKRRTDDIKKYVTKVKKNKVVVKGYVSVEPSVLYDALGYYMRAYIRFKVDDATNMKVEEEDLIYGDTVYFPNLKRDKWVETYVDIQLGSANGNSNGNDYAVYRDSIGKE